MERFTITILDDKHRRYFWNNVVAMLLDVFPTWSCKMCHALVEALEKHGRCSLLNVSFEEAEFFAGKIADYGPWGYHVVLEDERGKTVKEWKLGPCVVGNFPDSFKGWKNATDPPRECQGGIAYMTHVKKLDDGRKFYCEAHGAWIKKYVLVERLDAMPCEPPQPT
jgi:hypothetical protein